MQTPATMKLILAVGISVVIALIAGCQEEQNVTEPTLSTKRSRLIAAENAQLKQKIEGQRTLHARELERQKQSHERQMKEQGYLLDRCERQRKQLHEMSTQGVEDYMNTVLGPLADENEKLREENEDLKVQVQNLQGQIDRLRK